MMPLSRKHVVFFPIAYFFSCLLTVFFLLDPARLLAADRFYFVSIVEHAPVTLTPQVLLEWGPLEGSIPAEISRFVLYRSADSGPYQRVGTIDFAVAASQTIHDYVVNDIRQERRYELLQVLQEISDSLVPPGPDINDGNFAEFIHGIIDPASENFNPLQRMLLIRFHPAIARAAGLAFIDDNPGAASTLKYMLTAVTGSGESLPIGMTAEIDPRVLTILPAPTGLAQVRVAGCSEIHKNLDDLRIHLNWDVPDRPQDISLNILTYGYDLFWAAGDLGIIDFRAGIPSELHKVNRKPVIVSGSARTEGSDGFLARDSEENHPGDPAWQRGQRYYYYLVARDLAGNYSFSLPPVAATVVDAQPPVAPWRLHTEELSQVIEGSEASPRLSLVWDQVNAVNYIRYYGTDRAVCSSEPTQVCMAASNEECQDEAKRRCVDLDVVKYHVYRFPSPAAAEAWETDSDGDFWPDTIEDSNGTDPCDNTDFPHGSAPPELVATIDQNDSQFQRSLADMHVQMVFVDTAINASLYNRVHYYKVAAEDRNGNISPLSPPIRAVLYDRTQPDVNATLQVLDCDNYVADHLDTEVYRQPGDVMTLVDKTGKARDFTITRLCQGGTHIIPNELVLSGRIKDGFAHITGDAYPQEECNTAGCGGGTNVGYSVSFSDERGLRMAVSSPISIPDLCVPYQGAVVLDDLCLWIPAGPGMVAPQGAVKICADLAVGQMARVYYETEGQMSPVATVSYSPDPDSNGWSCMEIADMAGIVTDDLCLGMRVFSANHVGSGMHYFDCLEMVNINSPGPMPPVIEGIYSKENQHGEPCFDVRWSAPIEGQAAFVISMRSDTGTRTMTVFPETRDEAGQLNHRITLDPETDLNREWCVKMRSIDTSMQSSEWSRETCATWTAAQPENLPWPEVNEPVEQGAVSAFFMKEGSASGRPALTLSSNMSLMLYSLACQYSPTLRCLDEVPVCDGSDICVHRIDDDGEVYDEPVNFSNPQAGNSVAALMDMWNSIIYRQEQGRDFIQVSPIVDPVNFVHRMIWVEETSQTGEWRSYYQLRDPFFFLRRFESGAIGGVDPLTRGPVDPALHSGTRMIFLDHYPYVAGSTIRYKIVLIDPQSGEPKSVRTSNWLTLP